MAKAEDTKQTEEKVLAVKEKEASLREKELELWIPKTELGKKVKNGTITSVEEIFKQNLSILEPEIVDSLLDLEEKVVDLRKTTRVVRAGRKFSFRASVLVGDKKQYVGIGTANDAEKWSAIRKATRNAKLNLIKVKHGCGSWECTCGEPHTVPFAVEGKCASVRIKFLSAPKGVGLVAGDNIKDVLVFAGIKDVWTKADGATNTKLNFIRAAVDTLSKTTRMKASNSIAKKIGKER